MYKSHNIMSLLHDMKLVSSDRIFLSRDKSVDSNVCDLIFSVCDKFLACDVTSLTIAF